jgi:hypothetical protein
MPSSNTYQWYPALADIVIHAYGRCQIRRNALTVDHLFDAAMAANLLQVDWSNEQVNLWTVEQATTPLVPGKATYDVDPSTVMIMATWIRTGVPPDGTPPQRDRILTSVDRDSYASYPDKVTPGDPTVYWFNHLIQPTITLWQPPDDRAPRQLCYFRARQLQDAVIPGGITPETPYRFLEAYVSGLAFKLAELYAPARMEELASRAVGAFTKAKNRDVENAPLRIVPAMAIYTDAAY